MLSIHAEDEDSAFEDSDEAQGNSQYTHKHSIVSSGTYTLPAGDYEIDKKFEMVSVRGMGWRIKGRGVEVVLLLCPAKQEM